MLKSIFKKYPNLAEFARFCVVGFLAAGVDFGSFAILTRGLGVYFLWGNMVSVLLAMVFNFLINKYWTFGDKASGREFGLQTVKFFTLTGLTYALNQVIVFSLVTKTTWLENYSSANEDFLAKVVAIAIVLFINYFGNKYWTFRKKETPLGKK